MVYRVLVVMIVIINILVMVIKEKTIIPFSSSGQINLSTVYEMDFLLRGKLKLEVIP